MIQGQDQIIPMPVVSHAPGMAVDPHIVASWQKNNRVNNHMAFTESEIPIPNISNLTGRQILDGYDWDNLNGDFDIKSLNEYEGRTNIAGERPSTIGEAN